MQGISFGFYDDMHKRWKTTIEDVQRHDTNPEAEVVKKCIAAVQKDQDENVLKEHYGIKQFQDHDYGKSTPDKSIVSILGLILFWFANLPCTEEAKQEQTRYRKRLQLKMELLLNPESVEEFPLVSQEAYDNMILNDAQRTYCPKSFQSDEKKDYSPLYENELGKDKTQTQ